MSILTRQHTIITSQGSLAVEESGQGSIPVLLIHGNSSRRGVCRHQLQGRLAQNHRLIAFRLTGPRPVQQRARSHAELHASRLCGRRHRVARETGRDRGNRFRLVAWRPYRHRDGSPLLGDARADGYRHPTRRSQQHGARLQVLAAHWSRKAGRSILVRLTQIAGALALIAAILRGEERGFPSR
jgi:hypothetical protein